LDRKTSEEIYNNNNIIIFINTAIGWLPGGSGSKGKGNLISMINVHHSQISEPFPSV